MNNVYEKLKGIANTVDEMPSTNHPYKFALNILRRFKNEIDNIFWDEYDADKIYRLINAKYCELAIMLEKKGEIEQ